MQVQQGTTVINSNKDKDNDNDYNNHNDPLFDRKVDLITAGLPAGYARSLNISVDHLIFLDQYTRSFGGASVEKEGEIRRELKAVAMMCKR